MSDGHRDVWDLLVVGGGTAGIVGAKTAAALGARVALVERARTGGDCLWTGCVPSKAFLAAAHAAAAARGAHRLGVHVDGVRVDLAEVMAHVRGAIATIEPVDSPAALRAAGVTVVEGSAVFVGPDAVRVDPAGGTVRFRQALIATGSSPLLPEVVRGVDPLTSDSVWDLETLPPRLLVLGGGSIGCELGQGFARLGTRVTVVEAAAALLPQEHADAGQSVLSALRADGVDVRTGTCVVAARRRSEAGRETVLITLSDGAEIVVDALLAAVGRQARTADLDLAAAGVAADEAGRVVTDARLRTSAAHIWAAGDVTTNPRFTHVAGVHASIAAGNAVLGLRRSIDPDTVPRVTYTQPEVAAFGPGDGPTVRTVRHDEVDRAVTEQDVHGFTRVVLDRRGRIVGATVVGPRAGEVLAELVLAARAGLRARDVAGVMHAYPTWADGPWKAAIADVQAGLARPAVRRVTRVLAAARRRRMSSPSVARGSGGPADRR